MKYDYFMNRKLYVNKKEEAGSMNLLEVKNISKTYGTGGTAVGALEDVGLSVGKGEFVVVVGEVGAG